MRHDLTIVRGTGRELSSAIRPKYPPSPSRLRGSWTGPYGWDGEGVVEGEGTECVGWLTGGAGDHAQIRGSVVAAYGGSLQSRWKVRRLCGCGGSGPWRRRRVTGWPGRCAAMRRPRSASNSTAKTDDLSLEVEGFGHVKFPVTPAKARKLLGLGQPARFGRGEQTVTDPDVRDTWEIPKHLIRAPVGRRHAEGHPRDGKKTS